ncbi:Putative protein involved in ER to Golgi transport [Komagataella phaffii CBS 7435]|uniref:PRA1 family protein n=2 Tax=Komagataella phaffii TaxID=460519 RepID=C4QXH6_KOMPG|nr:uncharacterized protein PAS_chr1-4_0120 [Komagataella phaffii GS115]AOA61816.1 GQ67_02065T0 [Komagataella phaffii]CAH2446763.1 Putative protein involved in ER to Golgi transport [Komagataella phaffii CBS 7435]AOA66343.1 GQ68_02080T0 [Komagataella phaffii GS115]CAY67949.1 Protein localized to COPII vesicles, proposed to be involved in ER to Golgi transport [Komagataella phaffii GS115]SCV11875.1 Putative protein involved in ER to Golgi transport [Komagataella phaffii CBS 7435]
MNQFSSFSSFNPDYSNLGSTQSFRAKWELLRPSREFLDLKRVTKPTSLLDLQSRLTFNLRYFYYNYVLIALVFGVYFLLQNLLLLLLVVFILSAVFGISRIQQDEVDLIAFRVNVSHLYGFVAIVSIILVFISSPVGTVLSWATVSGITIFLHGSFLDKPIQSEV